MFSWRARSVWALLKTFREVADHRNWDRMMFWRHQAVTAVAKCQMIEISEFALISDPFLVLWVCCTTSLSLNNQRKRKKRSKRCLIKPSAWHWQEYSRSPWRQRVNIVSLNFAPNISRMAEWSKALDFKPEAQGVKVRTRSLTHFFCQFFPTIYHLILCRFIN